MEGFDVFFCWWYTVRAKYITKENLMRITPAAKRAIMIGSMCSLSYLAVYVARNILGAVSPQMIESGLFTTENIGTLSSVYFITYAVGQLINGRIGDKIKSKFMISLGLILAGISNFLFSTMVSSPLSSYIIYGMTGFFLSMIYGPMTKVVAENTEPIYATRCSLGYTFSSFFGTPLAGVLAALLLWQGVFAASSALLIIMGVICFIVFTIYERKGYIAYGRFVRDPKKGGSIRVLIKHQIIKFTLVAVLTGIVRTTVVFWLPTYLSQYLGLSTESAALVFTVATFIISATTFVAVFLYERLHRNMDLTVLVSFISSAVCFALVYIVHQSTLNIILMVMAIMSASCAASMLYSRYCPSLRDTGMVSSATGFIDFMSYMSASISSTLFANAVNSIGWGNLILVWFGLMVAGIIVALPYNKLLKKA